MLFHYTVLYSWTLPQRRHSEDLGELLELVLELQQAVHALLLTVTPGGQLSQHTGGCDAGGKEGEGWGVGDGGTLQQQRGGGTEGKMDTGPGAKAY